MKKKSAEADLEIVCALDWTRTSTTLGHHPLKMACLPISPPGLCDLAGIRTQGPYIKSVLLYQLSYRVVS